MKFFKNMMMATEPGAVYTAAGAGFISAEMTLRILIGIATLIYIGLGIRNRWKNKKNEEEEN